MRRAFPLLLMLTFCLMASSCRSRRPARTPQAAPSVDAVTSGASVPVQPSTGDFSTAAPEPPRSETIEQFNRTARDRGWIRDAFFAFDASSLDAEAREALRLSAGWLSEHPEYALLIEGHCDERGTEQYNLALGERRAAAAAAYLTTLGIDPARIRTVSYGEERPFRTGSDEEAWAANRRAHLRLARD